jgi:hypothetical protein
MPDQPNPLKANPDKKTTASDAAIEEAARRLTRRQIIKDASEYVKKHISRQPPVQRFFSFMPTMLTRVSPFHFKARVKYKEWPLVRLDSGDANSWGRMGDACRWWVNFWSSLTKPSFSGCWL